MEKKETTNSFSLYTKATLVLSVGLLVIVSVCFAIRNIVSNTVQLAAISLVACSIMCVIFTEAERLAKKGIPLGEVFLRATLNICGLILFIAFCYFASMGDGCGFVLYIFLFGFFAIIIKNYLKKWWDNL